MQPFRAATDRDGWGCKQAEEEIRPSCKPREVSKQTTVLSRLSLIHPTKQRHDRACFRTVSRGLRNPQPAIRPNLRAHAPQGTLRLKEPCASRNKGLLDHAMVGG
jgi:hypothetical protein